MMIESILPKPDILNARRILAIQPHYDDNDIGAGGTLALLKQAGAEIYYLTVTNDLMGIVDPSLSDEAATETLRRDQFEAGKLIGVKSQFWLGYPDAGEYDYFAVRRDLLKYIRSIQPDFVFAPDPWLAYEGHRDHVQTGLAATEAVMFAGLIRIASSDPSVDAAYRDHAIQGMVYYYTREPNEIMDVSAVWAIKIAAVRCYTAQFDAVGFDQLVMALEIKSRQVAQGQSFEHGEPLKVLHPSALHCGI